MRASTLILAAAASASAADTIPIITFDGAKETTHTWKEQNDPVMGGKSTGTFTIKNNVGVFDGEVVNVPFLKAPGFIKADTTDVLKPFPDLRSCTGLVMKAKAASDYAGFRLSFGTAHAPDGKFFAYGYKTHFNATVGSFADIKMPFTSFSDYWDDATGNLVKTCQDNKVYCPSDKAKEDLITIGVWGEGVGGKVNLEIESISGYGCTKIPQKLGESKELKFVGLATHYGDPYTGACESDEVNITIQGVTGAFCSPACKSGACPTDKPSGVTANPQCVLQDQSGNKYCALICSPSLPIKDQKSADAQCGTNASCKPIQGTGLCTYDQ